MRITYWHYLYGDDTALHHVDQFARAAIALGHSVDVHAMNLAAPSAAANGMGSPTARLRAAAKRRFGRFLHEPKEVLWNALYYRRELALVRRSRPDVLLVRNESLNGSCVAVARRAGLPLVLEVNAPAEESRLYLDEYAHLPHVAGFLEGWKARRADALTAVSGALAAHLIERYHLPEDKVRIVPNGADPALFRPDIAPDTSWFGTHADRVVVGFVGSFKKWHGPDLLARMILEVGRARPYACFLLVGDGPAADNVRRLIAEIGDRVRFAGGLPHTRLPAVVAALDVAVMPESNFYGSPLKVLEWMAAGRAVVAPAYGPVREVIDDGVHGCLFEPGDAGALVRAVTRLVDDPNLRRVLGAAAAARVRSSFSWRHNAERMIAACEEARQRHEGSAGSAAPDHTGAETGRNGPLLVTRP